MRPEDPDNAKGQGVEAEQDRREYVRVPANYPVIFRILDATEAEPVAVRPRSFYHLSSLISLETAEGSYHREESADPQLREMVQLLDWKINYLIKVIEEAKSTAIFPHQATILDISATGMKINTSEEVRVDTSIEFELVLPLLPFREMVLRARSMRCRRTGSAIPFEVGCLFEDIGQSDQEQVIRYVLKRQMQIQREKRKID